MPDPRRCERGRAAIFTPDRLTHLTAPWSKLQRTTPYDFVLKHRR